MPVTNGLGLTSRQIRAMPVSAWMWTLPPDLPIVSNDPDLCTILQRSCEMLPTPRDPCFLRNNVDVQAQLEAMTEKPTLVVYFEAVAYRDCLLGPDAVRALETMRLVNRGPDAVA